MMTKIHPKDSLRQLLRNVKAPDMGAQVAANWSKVLRFTHGTKIRADDLFEVGNSCFFPFIYDIYYFAYLNIIECLILSLLALQ